MKNRYEIRGDVTAIFLNRKDGSVIEAIIETNDLPIAQIYPNKWFPRIDKNVTYVTGCVRRGGTRVMYHLHRMIMETPEGFVVDHINHDGLFNKRCNLRNITSSQNSQNMNARGTHRGVHWAKNLKKWHAVLRLNGKVYTVGYYEDEEEAGKAASKARSLLMPYSNEPTNEMQIQIDEILRYEWQGNRSNKSSGIRGVSWKKKNKKWVAYVMVNKKLISLGSYTDISEAKNAAIEGRIKYGVS